MNFKKILVGIDGSLPSSTALDFALRRAKTYGSELVIAYAFDRASIAARACGPYGSIDPYMMVRACEEEADAILDSAKARATQAGVTATATLLNGRATSQLLDCVREQSVDAIVMGTHGRTGMSRLAFGSVAEGVLRVSNVPAFVVPEDAIVTAGLRTILVAVDGSDASVDAARYALDIAKIEGAELVFCSVVDPKVERWSRTDYGYDPEHALSEMRREASLLLEHMLKAARLAGVATRALLRCGRACDEITAAATEVGADLIAIGTHGRTGLGRLLLGSVAESVLRQSGVPVCAIRPIPLEWHCARWESRESAVAS